MDSDNYPRPEGALAIFVAYREYPAPGTGPIEHAVLVVLQYAKDYRFSTDDIADEGCAVWSYDADGRLVEKRSFAKDIGANRYVQRYADTAFDRGILPPDWKWPFTTWYEVGQVDDLRSFIVAEARRGHPEKRHRCQCCGYRTLMEPGRYETCPVCHWEDDGETDPSVESGPNHMTLAEARENFRTFGAYEPRWKDNVRPPRSYEL